MGPIGMPELIMIFIVLAIPIGLAAFVYFVVKKCNQPPASPPPPLPPETEG